MPRIIFQSCCLAVFVLAGAGCVEQNSIDPPSPNADPHALFVENPKPDPVPGESPSDNPKNSDTVELTIATFDELQASITASKGKVVVVDYWSTSCPPCMTEFPGLVAIHNEFPSTQVRCVSASLDYEGLADYPMEDCRKSSLEFLNTKQATLDK